MRKAQRTKVRWWRWRRNPLRRHSDVVEARIILGTWAAAVVGGAAVGAVVAQAVDGAIQHDHAERRLVTAVMVRGAPSATQDVATGVTDDHVTAEVRWTDTGGTVRTSETSVKAGTAAGSAVTVWTDGRGHLVSGPISSAEAATRVGLAGAGAGLVDGLLILAAGRMVRLRIERQATDQWAVEWDRMGPQWGRRTS